MPGLRLILTESAGDRAEAAIELAATMAALGRPVAVLLRGAALKLNGPTIAMLTELGVTVFACQTAMAAAGISAASLPEGVRAGGMVGFLADAGDAALLLA